MREIKFRQPNWGWISEGHYTGLKDKNGKDIYKDDFVKWDKSSDNYLVGFWYGKWVLVHPPTCRSEMEFDFKSKELEVIGNIYENPELLED